MVLLRRKTVPVSFPYLICAWQMTLLSLFARFALLLLSNAARMWCGYSVETASENMQVYPERGCHACLACGLFYSVWLAHLTEELPELGAPMDKMAADFLVLARTPGLRPDESVDCFIGGWLTYTWLVDVAKVSDQCLTIQRASNAFLYRRKGTKNQLENMLLTWRNSFRRVVQMNSLNGREKFTMRPANHPLYHFMM